MSNEIKGIIETKRFLSSTFKIKDLRQVDIILGIKVNIDTWIQDLCTY